MKNPIHLFTLPAPLLGLAKNDLLPRIGNRRPRVAPPAYPESFGPAADDIFMANLRAQAQEMREALSLFGGADISLWDWPQLIALLDVAGAHASRCDGVALGFGGFRGSQPCLLGQGVFRYAGNPWLWRVFAVAPGRALLDVYGPLHGRRIRLSARRRWNGGVCAIA